MIVALTSSNGDLQGPFESRFGRAPMFIVYNLDDQQYQAVDNGQNLNAPQGAGVQAAETVIRKGAKALVTGHCGPKAYRVLRAAGVKVYSTRAQSVAEALDRYQAGTLNEVDAADVDGHWM